MTCNIQGRELSREMASDLAEGNKVKPKCLEWVVSGGCIATRRETHWFSIKAQTLERPGITDSAREACMKAKRWFVSLVQGILNPWVSDPHPSQPADSPSPTQTNKGWLLPRERELTGVAQWVGHHPTNQKVTSLIPTEDTCLGCGPGPQLGACERQLIDVSLPLFLLPFPPL